MFFKTNLTDTRILLILISSLTFIVLPSLTGNLVQSVYADFNFAAAGDWGCTSNTDATVTNMNGKSPERVFGLGDYSYASTGTCWFNKIGPIDSITKIAIGNHEDDDSEGFSGYMSHFGLSQTYYSYNYQDVHVLVMDTDRNSYSSGSAQRNFVQNDLQSASTNPNIKWIIVYLHKEMYTSPNTCSSSSCSNSGSEPTNLRNGFHAMFDQYGVDLVLMGHVHNYQRTYQIKYDPVSPSSPTITDNNANTYTEGNGEVFALVGTGGVNFHALSGKASWVSSQQDDFFGQLDIKSTDNGNKLEGKFYRNGNNDILDSFSITKAAPPPSCGTNLQISGVTASGNVVGYEPANVLDNNLATRWASDGIGQSIRADLGSIQNICSVDIAWYLGDARQYHFVIATSTDGTTFTNKFSGDSSGSTLNSEKYTIPATDARYVRVTVNGNTANNWASITELDVFGSSSGPPPGCTTDLPISGVTASGNVVGYEPANVLDNNLATRWASDGIGQSIRADLGSTQNICSVDIAWYLGDARQYHFVIATSTDGTTFTNKFSGDSSGTTLNSEKYTIPATDARYVRVTVNGNTANNWASITELDVFGSSSSALSSTYNYGPSLTLSGPSG
jgi:hypothetical protein